MSELPELLRSWEETLAELDPRFISSLGPWLPRLAAALGPLRVRPLHSAQGEPDGYEGIGRRGPLERLLMSEWALADTHPEEFLRRLAMREQLVLQPARKEPQGSTRSVVLLDLGPSLMGAPRLVQLALLLTLLRRARRAGADLRWGVVQAPDKGLREWKRTQAEQLFADRSLQPAGAAEVERWRALLDEQDSLEDVWLLGDRDARAPWARRVEISDPYLPGQRVVDLRVDQGAHPLELRLPLPEDPVAAALLRSPFARIKVKPRAPRDTSDWPKGSARFNGRSESILLHTGDSLRIYRTSNWSWKQRRQAFHHILQRPPLAFGWQRGKAVWLEHQDGQLCSPSLDRVMEWRSASGGVPLPAGFQLPDANRAPQDFVAVPSTFTPGRQVVLVRDARTALWALDFISGDSEKLAAESAQLVRRDHKVYTIAGGALTTFSFHPHIESLAGNRRQCSLPATSSRWAWAGDRLQAVPLKDAHWAVGRLDHWHKGPSAIARLPVPEGGQVIALSPTKPHSPRNTLWWLDAARVTLGKSDPSANSVAHLPAPAYWAGVSPRGTIVTWLADGQIIFFSHEGRPGLRFHVGHP